MQPRIRLYLAIPFAASRLQDLRRSLKCINPFLSLSRRVRLYIHTYIYAVPDYEEASQRVNPLWRIFFFFFSTDAVVCLILE